MKDFIQSIKSILKWGLISILGLIIIGSVIGGIVVLYQNYQKAEVTVITFECFWKKSSNGENNITEWYLIKQRRNSDIPSSLYRGTHLESKLTDDLIYKQSTLNKYDDNYYYFNTDEKLSKWGHRINRKNLNTIYIDDAGNKTSASCKEISESDFYDEIEDKIEEKNKLYKF